MRRSPFPMLALFVVAALAGCTGDDGGGDDENRDGTRIDGWEREREQGNLADDDPSTVDGQPAGDDGTAEGTEGNGQDGDEGHAGDGPGDGTSPPPPSQEDLAAYPTPVWAVGDFWNYSADDDAWARYTVLELGKVADVPTYKVHLAEHRRGTIAQSTLWIDREMLGTLAVEEQGMEVTFGCPVARLMPLPNDSWSCSYPGGEMHESRRSGGWTTFPSPQGDQRGIQLFTTTDDGFSSKTAASWYGPDVGYRVAYIDDDGATYVLHDWAWQG